ncbi:TPA: hypothetical protein ACH3X1_004409 [Trebouxia sp. C0004]
MTGDYSDLTPEQLRQELVARDARIIQLEQANDDRAREELQSAVNYLYEQQVVDQATQKGSVYDVISMVTQKTNTHVTQTFARITRSNPELNPKCVKVRINGKGRSTPVAVAATLVEIAWLCPGRAATDFRRKG